MPVIYSAILAAGVMFGIYIAKSNGIVATEKGGDNSLFINEVFSLIDEEFKKVLKHHPDAKILIALGGTYTNISK